MNSSHSPLLTRFTRQLYRADQSAMRGFFIVEMKLSPRGDGVDALVEGDPLLAGAAPVRDFHAGS